MNILFILGGSAVMVFVAAAWVLRK
jgi:hypothetical protein